MSIRRKWAYRIEHILAAIDKIERYTTGMSAEQFAQNDLVIDAVVRNFQVIGEASRHVPSDLQALHPNIPWAEMTGMRNVIVHGYDVIRLDIVWRTVTQDVPRLVEPLRTLLELARREEEPPPDEN